MSINQAWFSSGASGTKLCPLPELFIPPGRFIKAPPLPVPKPVVLAIGVGDPCNPVKAPSGEPWPLSLSETILLIALNPPIAYPIVPKVLPIGDNTFPTPCATPLDKTLPSALPTPPTADFPAL